jgi:hypothetical protein
MGGASPPQLQPAPPPTAPETLQHARVLPDPTNTHCSLAGLKRTIRPGTLGLFSDQTPEGAVAHAVFWAVRRHLIEHHQFCDQGGVKHKVCRDVLRSLPGRTNEDKVTRCRGGPCGAWCARHAPPSPPPSFSFV